MGLNYICSNSTYDLTGSEYTTVFDKKKRLNYIVSGTINQLGLTTDSSASVYSPLKFNISGDDYYIGRSTTWNTTSTKQTTASSESTSYWTQSYYTYSQAMTCTSSGSSNGSNSNMTSTSRYLYSTKATYYARTSSVISSYWYSSSKYYSFSATGTTSRVPSLGTFSSSTYKSSSTKNESQSYFFGSQAASGEIYGNGTTASKSTTSIASVVNVSYTKITSTKYDTYKTSSRIASTSISMSGSTTGCTYVIATKSEYTYKTYSAYNGTASTYSTRYTSTYGRTTWTNEININATSTSTFIASSSTEAKSSTNGVTYNITVNTTTVDSSHNFV